MTVIRHEVSHNTEDFSHKTEVITGSAPCSMYKSCLNHLVANSEILT